MSHILHPRLRALLLYLLPNFDEHLPTKIIRIMKALIVITICLLVARALTEDPKEKLIRQRPECMKEADVDESLLKKVWAGDYKIDNDALKRYALCMLMRAELMTKDGKFRKEVVLAKAPETELATLDKLVDVCLSNKATTAHQTAWNFVQCFHEKHPKTVFL